ncbi:MAG: lytic transglycosylase domain-containing protein, partial [Bosea sp. (in: a-proteobacteria)]
MFLFSTPASRETAPANPVVSAIRTGADKTGTGFDYLLKTAQRESALEPDAKARTSSATGLFQFIEQTWFSMVKGEGARHGMSAYADAIKSTESGRLDVSDPAMREQILNLRKDPQASAVMAGAFTQKNREQLTAAIGREPNAGELYIAHVLGARGASDLIKGVASDPQAAAARSFPEAAGANRNIFFDKTGRPRTVQEVYGVLSASHSGMATTGPVVASQSQDMVPIAAALTPGRAKGLIGLFSTEGSRAPVSESVAKIWSGQPARGLRTTAALIDGPRYFPKSGAETKSASEISGDVGIKRASGSERSDSVASGSDKPLTFTVSGPLQAAPLPPVRPIDLGLVPPSMQRRPVAVRTTS